MVFDFLKPLHEDLVHFISELSNQSMGKKISLHTNDELPNLKGANVALITVDEYRGLDTDNPDVDFIEFRKCFYSMFPGNWVLNLIDLGTICPGNTLDDTYFLLKSICEDLIKEKIIPIVVGGSQDLTYPMYRAYDNLDQMVNVTVVDHSFNFSKENGLPGNSYLSRIIVEEPCNLFNYANIGYQTYFNSQEEIDLIEKLFFEAYRLGEISANVALSEPIFRDTDLVSFDFTSVQSSYSGNFNSFFPNGFSGKEICSLARYAGISDKVSSFGLFNFFNSPKEVTLVAQCLWYFLEGIAFRSHDYPFGSKENYYKYIVPIDEEELVFYKSDKTGRWWIEIPFISDVNNKLKRNTLLPCTHEDYLAACEQEIPERWWKAQRRNLL